MSFRRYDSYRDSGVEWLGEVPAHWRVSPLRSLARLESGHTPSRQKPEYWVDEECVIRWFTLADVGHLRNGVATYVDDTVHRISEIGMANSAARLLPAGTVILSRTASVGFSAILAEPMAVSQDFAAWICSDDLRPDFLLYCLRAMRQEFRRLMMGSTHQTIYMPDIAAFRVPVPSLSEQRAIAAFLDRETANIDALVEEQRRLIDLLKEKRQAVISHAVTKGLDPSAPMKDSGIEWLGEVPAHWSVRRLKQLANVQTGVAKGKDVADRQTRSVPYLRVANVQAGYLDLSDVAVIELPEEEVERYLLRFGDVLMNEGGDNDKLGRGDIWRCQIDPCVHQNHVFAVRPFAVESEWLKTITVAAYARHYFLSRSKQSTNLASISSTNLMELPVAMPPPEERRQICEYIGEVTMQLAALQRQCERGIEFLQERRAAVVSAAVTGKIHVRDRVAAAEKVEAA